MHLDRRLLGWGLFFIIAGAIPLLTRAGVLDPQLVSRWPTIWPLLLIAWGAGLLLRGTPVESLGGGVSAIVFGVMAGGAIASGFSGMPGITGCDRSAAGTAFATQAGTFGATGRLGIELSCGTLAIGSVDGSGWSVTGTSPDGAAPKIDQSNDRVSIERRGSDLFDGPSRRTTWTVSVPRTPELDLAITMNAGDSTVDLAGANLAVLDLTVNAGSSRVDLSGTTRLGDVRGTVNASSATLVLPTGSRDVSLSLNAGNLTVCTPVGAPLRVRWSGAVGSNNFDGAGLVKLDAATWSTPGFSDGAPHLELRASANAGSFKLDLDGTCDP